MVSLVHSQLFTPCSQDSPWKLLQHLLDLAAQAESLVSKTSLCLGCFGIGSSGSGSLPTRKSSLSDPTNHILLTGTPRKNSEPESAHKGLIPNIEEGKNLKNHLMSRNNSRCPILVPRKGCCISRDNLRSVTQ